MHPRVLRELVDVVAKLLSIVFQKSCQSANVPSDRNKGNMTSFCFENIKLRTLGTTGHSASLQLLVRLLN